MSSMLSALPWYSSPSSLFWATLLLILLTLIIAAVGILTWRSGVRRRRVMCSIVSRSRLLTAPEGMRDELQILYEDERLVDPYVLILEIANAGRASIPSALFDRNRGIVFKLPSLILKVLSVEHTPTSAPTPTLVANESTLELRPELLMRGEVIRTSLLIEGPIDNLALCLNPLGDVSVEIRDREAWLRQRTRRRFIATVVTAAMTLAASVVLTALTSVTFSRENSYLSTTEQAARDYACGNLVQNLQIASFGMTLAYADVT